ncbi:MAG TPA: SDR family oxidoreductase [Nitrospiria bacterium]|nr:SDR family oxidoreductase [Nitrospiria bacterium]
MGSQLSNRVAIVTGGSRGIGYSIAEAYLRAGARIAICARDEVRLREAAGRLSRLGEVLAVPCDVSDLEQVSRMVEKTIDRFGRIDILVNNAGIGMTYGRVGEIDPQQWAYVIAVNLIGTFNCCHSVIPRMVKEGGGKIINLKGYGADFPSPRVTAYGASKAAIVGFTRSLAREYKRSGITVNYLSPGVVKTDLLLNREATEEGRPYLKRFDPLIDLLAVPVERPAMLAVKMASSETDGITGKGFRVTSRTAFLVRALRFGLGRLWRR